MIRTALVAFLVLVGSCAPAEEVPSDLLAGSATPLIWPEPPAEPKIKFLYAFREPRNLGFRISFFERVWETLVGEENRRMVKPYAIAVEGQKIVVADPGARAVHVFDRKARAYSRITKAGQDVLVSPVGVAIGAGRIYVADSALGKVFAFDGKGELVLSIADMERPTGLAYSPTNKRLYVADTLGHRVIAFDEGGKALFSFGNRGTLESAFNFPSHLAVWGGKVYVNDTMNFRLQIFDLDGNHLSTFGAHGDGSGNFAQPKGVAADGEGHLYVADAIFNRVQVFDGEGRFLLAFGGIGGTVGRFWLPAGLFIADNRIYVADTYNRRVQVFQYLGGT